MGLKKTNYEVKSLGITLENAYAKVTSIYIDKVGNAKAILSVQQSREVFKELNYLENIEFNFVNDKIENVFEQAYLTAKQGVFASWEDDIPVV